MKLNSEQLMRAFAPVPPDFESSVETGFQRGELAMKRRHRFTATLSAAAVFVVLLTVAALAAGNLGRPRPDNVVLSGGSAPQATPMPTAFMGNVTRLPLQTASSVTPAPTAFGVTPLPTSFGVTPAPTAHASIEPVSLEQLLTNVLTACIEEGGAQTDANTKTMLVEKAVRILMAVPEEYGADVARWLAPIRECLMRELGLSEVYIAERELVNLLVSYLGGAEQALSPEEVTTPVSTSTSSSAYAVLTPESTLAPNVVYVWNEPVELSYDEEAETASASYCIDAQIAICEAPREENGEVATKQPGCALYEEEGEEAIAAVRTMDLEETEAPLNEAG